MPRAASRTSAQTTSRRTKAPTALDLLKDDHAQVEKVFKQFERFHKNDDDDGMLRCAQAACKALTVHAQIEEEIFYPALREAAEAEDALEEADVEHAHIKELVGQIENGEPGDDRFEARVTVLSEYVQHHVKEEESTIFSKARKSGVDLVALGERLMARKQELGGDELPAEMAALTSRSRAAHSRNGARASR
jgi:hemerythrin superfamily protein